MTKETPLAGDISAITFSAKLEIASHPARNANDRGHDYED